MKYRQKSENYEKNIQNGNFLVRLPTVLMSYVEWKHNTGLKFHIDKVTIPKEYDTASKMVSRLIVLSLLSGEVVERPDWKTIVPAVLYDGRMVREQKVVRLCIGTRGNVEALRSSATYHGYSFGAEACRRIISSFSDKEMEEYVEISKYLLWKTKR